MMFLSVEFKLHKAWLIFLNANQIDFDLLFQRMERNYPIRLISSLIGLLSSMN